MQRNSMEVSDEINSQYKKYCELSRDTYHEISYDYEVYTYDELLKTVKEKKGETVEEKLKTLTEELINKNVDKGK